MAESSPCDELEAEIFRFDLCAHLSAPPAQPPPHGRAGARRQAGAACPAGRCGLGVAGVSFGRGGDAGDGGQGDACRPRARGAPDARAGGRRDSRSRRGLRGLPHRPACDRRRTRRAALPDRARPRGRRRRREARAGRRGLVGRRAGRRALARAHLRPLLLLRRGPREPLRPSRISRLHAGRRLRHAYAGRSRLSYPPAPPTPTRSRPPRCSAPGSSAGAASNSRDRRRRIGLYGFGAAAHIVAQLCRWQRPRCLRFHPRRRRGGAGVRPLAGRGLGGRLGRGAARAARRGDPLRAGGGAGSRRAQSGAQGRAGRRAAAST